MKKLKNLKGHALQSKQLNQIKGGSGAVQGGTDGEGRESLTSFQGWTMSGATGPN